MKDLVTTAWLAANLDNPSLRLLDCTYVDPASGRDPAAEWRQAHIPGACFLDLKALSDPNSPLPIMLPPQEVFESGMDALGVGNGDMIVLYDDSPWRTAARGWFAFRSFGMAVAILDGGLGKWRAEGRPLTDEVRPSPSKRSFHARPLTGSVRDFTAMQANLDSHAEQVVDARSAARFSGAEPDPRPGVAPGHIPGSINLPYTRLFAADGTYKAPDELAAEFNAAGVALDRPLVATCGSGVTASAIAFAAHLLGADVPVYDGSWTEWGADPTTPKATA